ncbi:MAG: hypothetical protein O8C58_03285 [Candidatus Methanoperedens sp.]|nr:hypothetical protein [Candidatus Methanoperedens sp.]
MEVKRFDKYTDVMNEVLKGSGIAIYTGGEKEIIVKKIHESIDYIESHAQDTPFFMALADGKLIGSKCPACGYRYATAHMHCGQCGNRTEWFDLPGEGKIHCHSVSKYGGGKFLKEAPFSLILVEFEGVDSYLMAEYRPKEILNLKRMKKEFRRNPHFDIRDVYFVPVG